MATTRRRTKPPNNKRRRTRRPVNTPNPKETTLVKDSSTGQFSKPDPKPVTTVSKVKKNNGKSNGGNGNGKLTPNRKIFVDEWLKHRNGTKAYRVAYPSVTNDETARAAASRLLTYVNVQEYISKSLEELSATARIDQEWVLKRYEMLSDYKMSDYMNDDGTMKPLSEISKEAMYAIEGFKHSRKITTTRDGEEIAEDRIKEFKLPSKKGVLDSVGKYTGLFAKDNEQSNKGVRGNIQIGQAVIHVTLVE
jgi:phage terminase small subunit